MKKKHSQGSFPNIKQLSDIFLLKKLKIVQILEWLKLKCMCVYVCEKYL